MWRLGLVDVEPREVGVARGAAARVIKAAMARVGVATLVMKKRILDQIDHLQKGDRQEDLCVIYGRHEEHFGYSRMRLDPTAAAR